MVVMQVKFQRKDLSVGYQMKGKKEWHQKSSDEGARASDSGAKMTTKGGTGTLRIAKKSRNSIASLEKSKEIFESYIQGYHKKIDVSSSFLRNINIH